MSVVKKMGFDADNLVHTINKTDFLISKSVWKKGLSTIRVEISQVVYDWSGNASYGAVKKAVYINDVLIDVSSSFQENLVDEVFHESIAHNVK